MLDSFIRLAQRLDKRGLHKEADRALNTMVRVAQGYQPSYQPMPVALGGSPQYKYQQRQGPNVPYQTAGTTRPQSTMQPGPAWDYQYRKKLIDEYNKSLQSKGMDPQTIYQNKLQNLQLNYDRMNVKPDSNPRAQMEYIVNRMQQKIQEQYQIIDKLFEEAENKATPPNIVAYNKKIQGYSQLIPQVQDYFTRVMHTPWNAQYLIDDFKTKPQNDPTVYFHSKLQEYAQNYPQILQQAQQQRAMQQQMYQRAQSMGLLPHIQQLMQQQGMDFVSAYENVMMGFGMDSGMGFGGSTVNPMMQQFGIF